MGEASAFLGAEGREGGELTVGDAGEQDVEMQAVGGIDAAIVEFCVLCDLNHPDELERELLGFRPPDDRAPEPLVSGGARILVGVEGIVGDGVWNMANEMDRGLDGFSGLADLESDLEGV